MSIKITQSNKKDYIGRDFLFHRKRDQIIIGNKVLGMGKKFEISCKDVKEFKVLDQHSKPRFLKAFSFFFDMDQFLKFYLK